LHCSIVVAPNIETCCGAVKYQLVARFYQTKYLVEFGYYMLPNKLLILVPASAALCSIALNALNKLPVAFSSACPLN
jgi:hypothetical protein